MPKRTLLNNPYLPKPYKITNFYQETINNFTLTVDMKAKHEPGQFVQVSIPGIGEAPISICSDSPKYVKLNINKVGDVTNSLEKLKKGDTIFIRGPYGKGYPMKEFKGRDLIFVGGGCGIAPLKSVIEYVENHRADFGKVFLFLGYKSNDDVLFKKELERWKNKYNLEVTLDKKNPSKVCYDAKEGFITDALKKSPITPERKIVTLCGPPIMMKYSVQILKDKGFNDEQIYLSAERLMYCALGICCHCMIRGKFTCLDGPVFRYDQIKDFKND